MVTWHHRGDPGHTLVELMLVVGLLGAALMVVFGSVQLLTTSAAASVEDSAATHDLSYNIELLSKTLMSGRIVYADDYRVAMLAQRSDGTWEMHSVYTTGSADPARGSLVWERWGSDSAGTALVGASHNLWVMSDRNVNMIVSPTVPLFGYYTDATDAGLMPASGKSASPDTSLSAFAGTMPGGYPVGAIGRIRLHVLAKLNTGMRDDFRDIVVRFRS